MATEPSPYITKGPYDPPPAPPPYPAFTTRGPYNHPTNRPPYPAFITRGPYNHPTNPPPYPAFITRGPYDHPFNPTDGEFASTGIGAGGAVGIAVGIVVLIALIIAGIIILIKKCGRTAREPANENKRPATEGTNSDNTSDEHLHVDVRKLPILPPLKVSPIYDQTNINIANHEENHYTDLTHAYEGSGYKDLRNPGP